MLGKNSWNGQQAPPRTPFFRAPILILHPERLRHRKYRAPIDYLVADWNRTANQASAVSLQCSVSVDLAGCGRSFPFFSRADADARHPRIVKKRELVHRLPAESNEF
jgi:hypothetical protein